MWIVANMQLLSMIFTVLKLRAQPLKEKLGPDSGKSIAEPTDTDCG